MDRVRFRTDRVWHHLSIAVRDTERQGFRITASITTIWQPSVPSEQPWLSHRVPCQSRTLTDHSRASISIESNNLFHLSAPCAHHELVVVE